MKYLSIITVAIFSTLLLSFKAVDLPKPNDLPKTKRIAIVVSNSTISEITKMPVGFFWSELTHPYLEFINAGYEVEIFSNDGGKCNADAMSDPRDANTVSANDLITMGFVSTERLMKLVENTKKVSEIDVAKFDAIVVAGGQAPIYTFEKAIDLQKKVVEFYEAKKVTAALCHGVAIFKYAKLSDGTYLAKGKTLTGFANTEEDDADKMMWQYKIIPEGQHVSPWRVEDAMKEIGAKFVSGAAWQPFAVRDGNLVTGQQNASGAATALKMLEAINQKPLVVKKQLKSSK